MTCYYILMNCFIIHIKYFIDNIWNKFFFNLLPNSKFNDIYLRVNWSLHHKFKERQKNQGLYIYISNTKGNNEIDIIIQETLRFKF